MPKINKVYPPFFNGVTQQNPELTLDSQCKEMKNCIPDLVTGLKKRPPVTFKTVKDYATFPEMEAAKAFHTYDRGEDDEEYIFLETGEATNPVQVFNKNGDSMVVEYASEAVKTYLNQGKLKGLTVQDRTWIFSKTAVVGLDTTNTEPLREDYTNEAYFWLKRGSGDRYNPFNYAVYLDGETFSVDPDKPSNSTTDPATGAEDSDKAAALLAAKINATTAEGTVRYDFNVRLNGENQTYSTYTSPGLLSVTAPTFNKTLSLVSYNYNSLTGKYTFTIGSTIATGLGNGLNNEGVVIFFSQDIVATFTYTKAVINNFNATRRGSVLRIRKNDLAAFTFSSWDSWGNQASEGWQGSVNTLSELPKDMPFSNVYVRIVGEEGNKFTDYFVKWNGSSWEECLDPAANRGKLINMPIKCDRTGLVAGVATFTLDIIEWSQPRVGNEDNNPDPSFVNGTIQDLFFYKNRLGLASADSVVLSENANYTNFYTSTAIDVLDVDLVDITIATNQASKIYFVKPFNNSLYIFTKYAQYELLNEGYFSPSSVSLSNTTNYPMAIDVEPVVVNDSLYFISTTNNRQQLREYIKTDNLTVKGIDLNISTPTYLDKPIKKLIPDGVLGFVLCCAADNTIYLYNYKEDGEKRIQSAWNTWTVLETLPVLPNSYEYFLLASTALVLCKTDADYRYHQLQLDYNIPNTNIDNSSSNNVDIIEYPYRASVLLPDYYPQLTSVRTPMNKMLIKKITVEGTGDFDATVYRKDYGTTYTKSHTNSLRDLDLHIASKVGNVEVTIFDETRKDFVITSIVIEGLFSTTSKEMK